MRAHGGGLTAARAGYAQKCEFEDPYILLVEKKIATVQSIVPVSSLRLSASHVDRVVVVVLGRCSRLSCASPSRS